MVVDWVAIWGIVGPAAVGLATWLKTRKPNQAKIDAAVSAARAETAGTDGTATALQLLRGEVERLSARVSAMEAREGRLVRHVYRLEAMIRSLGKEPPPFDIESDSLKVGGTD